MFFLDSKITVDGDCSQKIKRRLPLGRKAMTNLDSILKNRDITLPTKVYIVRAMFVCFFFSQLSCTDVRVWTTKKTVCQRTDAFELWFWRRLLRVPS